MQGIEGVGRDCVAFSGGVSGVMYDSLNLEYVIPVKTPRLINSCPREGSKVGVGKQRAKNVNQINLLHPQHKIYACVCNHCWALFLHKFGIFFLCEFLF